MAKEGYAEKLLSPHWQRKRQDILTRDNYRCVLCSDTETTLHVHHKEYISGREPWDYEDDNFQTLCKDCHYIIEYLKGVPILSISAFKNNHCRFIYVFVRFDNIQTVLLFEAAKEYTKMIAMDLVRNMDAALNRYHLKN